MRRISRSVALAIGVTFTLAVVAVWPIKGYVRRLHQSTAACFRLRPGMTESEARVIIGDDCRRVTREVAGKRKSVLLLPTPPFVGSARYAEFDENTGKIDSVVCEE